MKLGFEIWADWVGLEPAIRAQVWNTYSEKIASRCEGLERRLFSPPSQEEKKPKEEYRLAKADDLLKEMSSAIGFQPREFWPEGRPYALCLTHDVDRILATYHKLRGLGRLSRPFFRRITRILTGGLRDSITAFVPTFHESNSFFNFKKLQKIEGQLGVRSACYVLFEKRRIRKTLCSGEIQHSIGVYHPEKIQKELMEFESSGNEIGLHGSFSSWNDSRALLGELGRLKKMGIREVWGGRNHYLNYNLLNGPTIQNEAGLIYDSSLGFNYQTGFRCGTSFPFRLDLIWELPMHLMDTALRFAHVNPSERVGDSLGILNEVKRQKGVLTLNWHLHHMNAEEFSEEVDHFSKIVEQAKRDGAWIALPGELIQWWEKRSQSGEISKPKA